MLLEREQNTKIDTGQGNEFISSLAYNGFARFKSRNGRSFFINYEDVLSITDMYVFQHTSIKLLSKSFNLEPRQISELFDVLGVEKRGPGKPSRIRPNTVLLATG